MQRDWCCFLVSTVMSTVYLPTCNYDSYSRTQSLNTVNAAICHWTWSWSS